MEEQYITNSELAILLVAGFGPPFIIAALVQRLVLIKAGVGHRVQIAVLVTAVILEFILSFVIWLSPVHTLFIYFNSLSGFLQFVSIPLQASAIAVTLTTSMGNPP
jgi:hypothetical protein